MKYPHLSLQFQPSYFWLNVKNIAGHMKKTADLNPSEYHQDVKNSIIISFYYCFFCFLFQIPMMLMGRS